MVVFDTAAGIQKDNLPCRINFRESALSLSVQSFLLISTIRIDSYERESCVSSEAGKFVFIVGGLLLLCNTTAIICSTTKEKGRRKRKK